MEQGHVLDSVPLPVYRKKTLFGPPMDMEQPGSASWLCPLDTVNFHALYGFAAMEPANCTHPKASSSRGSHVPSGVGSGSPRGFFSQIVFDKRGRGHDTFGGLS